MQQTVRIWSSRGHQLIPSSKCGFIRLLIKTGKAVPIATRPFAIRLKTEDSEVFEGLYTNRTDIFEETPNRKRYQTSAPVSAGEEEPSAGWQSRLESIQDTISHEPSSHRDANASADHGCGPDKEIQVMTEEVIVDEVRNDAALKQQIESQRQEIFQKDAELKRKDAELQGKDGDLRLKDEMLRGKDEQLRQKDELMHARLAQKDAEIRERDARIRELEAKLQLATQAPHHAAPIPEMQSHSHPAPPIPEMHPHPASPHPHSVPPHEETIPPAPDVPSMAASL